LWQNVSRNKACVTIAIKKKTIAIKNNIAGLPRWCNHRCSFISKACLIFCIKTFAFTWPGRHFN